MYLPGRNALIFEQIERFFYHIKITTEVTMHILIHRMLPEVICYPAEKTAFFVA
jgi:hypothetical protein